MMVMTDIIAVVVAVLASSGLWGLIQFLVNRKDKTAEKIDKIMEIVTEALQTPAHAYSALMTS